MKIDEYEVHLNFLNEGKGKKPGINLIENVDLKNLILNKKSKIKDWSWA